MLGGQVKSGATAHPPATKSTANGGVFQNSNSDNDNPSSTFSEGMAAVTTVDASPSNSANPTTSTPLTHDLMIMAKHINNKLRLSFLYDQDSHSGDQVAALANSWLTSLQEIVKHTQHPDTIGAFTLEDMPLIRSQTTLDEILSVHLPALRIPARNVEDIYPATPLQKGLVIAMMRDPSAYTVQHVYELDPLPKEALETANGTVNAVVSADTKDAQLDMLSKWLASVWNMVAAQHPILRTAFLSTSQDMYQMVLRQAPCNFDTCVWTANSYDQFNNRLKTLLKEDRERGFSLTDTCLVRFKLIKALFAGDDKPKFFLIFTNHHAILDGWSMPILMSDFTSACNGIDIQSNFRPPFREYVEFISSLADDEESEAFWKQVLEPISPSSPLPLPRPPQDVIDNQYSGLERYQTLVSVFDHARGKQTSLKMVGLLINTIAIPVVVEDDQKIIDLLDALQDFHVESLYFGHAALSEVQRWVQPTTAAAQQLFHSLIVFENYPNVGGTGDEKAVEFGMKLCSAKEEVDYPLAGVFGIANGVLAASFKYDACVYQREDIERVAATFDSILQRIVMSALFPSGSNSVPFAKMTVATLDAFLDKKLFDSLHEFQFAPELSFAHPDSTRDERLLHVAFEMQAEKRPNAIAVQQDGFGSITYGELEKRSNVLAWKVKEALAATTNNNTAEKQQPAFPIVAVLCSRSIEMVLGILAALKAGAAYAPMDPGLPKERLKFMLADAGCSVILSTSGDMSQVVEMIEPARAAFTVIDISQEMCKSLETLSGSVVVKPPEVATPASPAYTVYTSGTTGKPKGVVVHHGGATNLVMCSNIDSRLQLGVTPTSRVMQFMGIGFDGAVWEIFLALSFGATLVLRNDATILNDLKTVSHLIITPTGLSQLKPEEYPNLECIIAVGEACPLSLVERWLAGPTAEGMMMERRFVNGYGPTETSIVSHATRLYAGKPVTIGQPTANTITYILDVTNNRLVPKGVPGQIFIAGVGVSKGYLNNPELTATKFIHDPFSPQHSNGLMYCTGDLGRWTSEGHIEYLGRTDDQVKVKGYRIELNEIALAMNQYPGIVSSCAVVVKGENDNQVLVGFYVTGDGGEEIDTRALRAMVVRVLPRYMVPGMFIGMAEFPMTTNGKVNRQKLTEIALAQLPTHSLEASTVFTPPTPPQKPIAQRWWPVLGGAGAQSG
ncbi:hypothetical protein HK102_010719, partial [Quaeritorhiza haematococci]